MDEFPGDMQFFADSGDPADDVIFFNRQHMLIDGSDDALDLIITDDPNAPTLGQMLANGMDGDSFNAILDGNGEHIPMVRNVEILVTATTPETAESMQDVLCRDDLLAQGIEFDHENGSLTLTGWHAVENGFSGDAPGLPTALYENGAGLRLETTLMDAAARGAALPADMGQDGLDDLHTVITLVQDGNL